MNSFQIWGIQSDTGCITFPRVKSEKLKHSWKGLIAMYRTENNRFLAHNSLGTMNLTLHAQTERVYRDNWQIPWWNETLCMLKATSVFALCLANELPHFDVLPHPCTKIHSFCQVNSFPISQAAIGTSGNWFDPWHVDISFGEINQNVRAKRVHEMCQMKPLESKVFMGMVLEYLSSKWDVSERHANHRRTNQDHFFWCHVSES